MKRLLSSLLIALVMTSTARADWGGGDLVGNGGGCAELLLRVSFNRINQHSQTYLIDAPEEHALHIRQLIESNPPETLDSRLVFSEEKFETCLRSGGFIKGGACLSRIADDNHLYLSPSKLYSQDGETLITKDNAIATVTDLMLQKNGVRDSLRTDITTRLQAISQRAWIEQNNLEPSFTMLTLLYSKNTESFAQEMIIGNGKDFYKVSDLLKKTNNDPCLRFLNSPIASWKFESPWWQANTLTVRGVFISEDGKRLSGDMLIRFNPNSVELQYRGLTED